MKIPIPSPAIIAALERINRETERKPVTLPKLTILRSQSCTIR